MNTKLEKLSKYMSFILRHSPDSIGLNLDEHGWTSIEEFLSKSKNAGKIFSYEELIQVVEQNDKKRFTISDGKIRAAQGHSIAVNLDLQNRTPPAYLFHGTATRFLEAILKEGLKPQARQQVHLSPDKNTAIKVGIRHGKPVVLTIRAAEMHKAGYHFFLSDNGVWLTDEVPKEFIQPIEES